VISSDDAIEISSWPFSLPRHGDREEGVRPALEDVPVLGRDAEQVTDRGGGETAGEVGDQVEGVAFGHPEAQLTRGPRDAGPQRLDPPLGERAGDQTAQAGVVRRVVAREVA
jgi:hypothetical protein